MGHLFLYPALLALLIFSPSHSSPELIPVLVPPQSRFYHIHINDSQDFTGSRCVRGAGYELQEIPTRRPTISISFDCSPSDARTWYLFDDPEVLISSPRSLSRESDRVREVHRWLLVRFRVLLGHLYGLEEKYVCGGYCVGHDAVFEGVVGL